MKLQFNLHLYFHRNFEVYLPLLNDRKYNQLLFRTVHVDHDTLAYKNFFFIAHVLELKIDLTQSRECTYNNDSCCFIVSIFRLQILLPFHVRSYLINIILYVAKFNCFSDNNI